MTSSRYCFTLNNYTDDEYVAMDTWPNVVYLIVGKEVAPDTGTPHLQGYVVLKKDQRVSAMKKLNARAHWEKANGSTEHNFTYCSKDGDYKEIGVKPLSTKAVSSIGGSVQKRKYDEFKEAVKEGRTDAELMDAHMDIMSKYPRLVHQIKLAYAVPFAVKIEEPHAWQASVMDIVNGIVHPRFVYWVVDRVGGKGKTHLTDHLITQNGAICFQGGTSADCSFAWLGESPAVFDFARNQADHVNYTFIEQIKNGRVFSPKYESRMKSFPRPHVIVFANFEPDYTKLSADRWQILDLDSPNTMFMPWAANAHHTLHRCSRGYFDSRMFKTDEFSEN